MEGSMSLLDFIKNRRSQQESTDQQPKPETAKEMYTREAIEENANRVGATPDQEKRAQQIGEEMRTATQSSPRLTTAPPDAPTDQSGNTAHLQNQSNQDKAQEALSPTDGFAGKTALQETSVAQETTNERKQNTIARPAPSWER
jgi:hypothetical protein